MRHYRRLLILFVLTIAATSGYGQKDQKLSQTLRAGTHTEGRYQLFQGSYYGNHVAQQDAVFLIDSETGKTWMFSETVNDKTGVLAGWLPLGEVERVPKPTP